MNKQRALKLAEFLETKVKRSWFYMGDWATFGWKEKKCGTTACAMGWATVAFPRSGLSLTDENEEEGEFSEIAYTNKHGDEFFGDDAIRQFFKCNDRDFIELFYPMGYEEQNPTPKRVAKRIRQYLEDPQKISKMIEEWTL
jgi:hypothetical protein